MPILMRCFAGIQLADAVLTAIWLE